MPKSERILLWSCAAASLVLRAIAFFRYRFDSDEQQHLHVAWGWTAGLVQYRDLFDNHVPLFHLVTAPFLALVGERRDVLLWMRLPMLALFAVVIWGTYELGKRMYDARVGMWSAVLLSLFPSFFLKSLEYRTDNLWNALWIIALVLLVRQRSMFWIGLVMGCAMAVSLKTVLLLITIAAAALITRTKLRDLHKFAAGFVIVPAILLATFAALGAWNEMLYCTLEFNRNLALTRKYLWVGRTIFPFAAAAVVYAAWYWRKVSSGWRYLLAVAMGVYTVTLAGFWILISPRDFLPLMPLAAIFAAAAMTRARRPLVSFAVVALAFVIGLWHYSDHFRNRTAWHTTMLDQALRLTRPNEMLMDLKGETIFRKRPFYYAFENITRAQMSRGIIKDTIREDVIRTRTYVAQADGPMWPPKARAFLSENFLDMGRLRAAGQWLRADGSFTIAIPGEYIIVNEDGPLGPPRDYPAGRYRIAPQKKLTGVMWAPAFRRGHSPFHLRDRDF